MISFTRFLDSVPLERGDAFGDRIVILRDHVEADLPDELSKDGDRRASRPWPDPSQRSW